VSGRRCRLRHGHGAERILFRFEQLTCHGGDVVGAGGKPANLGDVEGEVALVMEHEPSFFPNNPVETAGLRREDKPEQAERASVGHGIEGVGT